MSAVKAKCPYCGTELEVSESLDMEYFNGEYYDHVDGCCPKCNKGFTWTERFSYAGFSNLLTDSEEE